MNLDRAAAEVARATWTEIGEEFNANRQKNRAAAYRVKQQRINQYFGILTELISPKDLLDEARRCEEFMSEGTTQHGTNALDELADFLNGKDLEKQVQ